MSLLPRPRFQMLSLHILCKAIVGHLISGFLNLEVGFQVVLGLYMCQLLNFPLGCFATSNQEYTGMHFLPYTCG